MNNSDATLYHMDTIFNEDCLVGMQRIPDHSIDMILCDLPYEVLHRNNPAVQWDRILPMDKLWEQYLRVAKHNAAIVLFAQGMFSARLMMSQPRIWKYNLIWEKSSPTGFLNSAKMPLRSHEDICVFYRIQPTYNPQMTRSDTPIHDRGILADGAKNQCCGEYHAVKATQYKVKRTNTYDSSYSFRVPRKTDEYLRFPRSVLNFSKEHGKQAVHPTQKPVDLLAYLIRTYTNPGDIVLDNCMGSGSTAIAAIREKRHYIGFETDPDYYAISQRRINTETAQLKIDLSE